MKQMTYAAALVDGLRHAMQCDERVIVVSSHLLGLGPHRTLMDPLQEEFHDRFFEPPNSEAALAGLGAAAAMVGDRPVINFSTANFAYLAWSQIVNDAASAHHMTNGAIRVPVVYYAMHGVRGGGAAQHSSSPQAMLWNCPGLEIVLPSSPADAKGLLVSALKSDNPTFFLTHAKLLGTEGPVPEGPYELPLGRAEVKRAGRDVTIVATSYMVVVALAAADALAKEGIEAEVIDPRSLVPLDEEAILASVARTGRVVVVDECHLRCSTASEITATIAEKGFRFLKSAPARIARADVPTAFSAPLEAAITPDRDKVIAAVRRVMADAPLPAGRPSLD
jgi:pyruvate/2-oxoglutarate/acetoin dehydrogenase E1 component